MKRLLVCPKCKEQFREENGTLKCKNSHSFDIARQGYVNLLLGNSKGSGDDKEMCRSRHEFHSFDYYSCLSAYIADFCVTNECLSVLDAGCGEGYYLRKIRDKFLSESIDFNSLCGIDLAKEAISIGARLEKDLPEDKRIEYAVCGIFDMPVTDASVDCLLSVFAPVPDLEALRVLRKNGLMLVVSPGEKHLEGLKKAVYDNIYYNDVTEKLIDGFEYLGKDFIEDTITVEGDNITNLFHMTPYYWKTSEKDFEKLKCLSVLTTKIEFVVSIYKKI